MARWWNEHAPFILPHSFISATAANFTVGYLTVGEVPTEDWSGIGCGLSVLLVVSVIAGCFVRKNLLSQSPMASHRLNHWVRWGIWAALLAYGMESGMENAVRIVAPYYPLLVLTLVAGSAQSVVVRRRWWQLLAAATWIVALLVLVISPDRPLWPAQTILGRLSAEHPNSAVIRRAAQVYSVYRARNDDLAAIRALLPPDATAIGLVAGADDNDVSLWRPFGTRRVQHFLLTDPPGTIWSRVHYVVVGGFHLGEKKLTIDDWLHANDAEIIASTNATVKISEGPQFWYLTRRKQ